MSGWITPEQAGKAIREGDGRGVRIAVLDSGIEISHSHFEGRSLLDDVTIEASRPAEGSPGGGVDLYGHGTAVAGIIWSVAPKAEIGSFRVLGPNLGGRTARIALAAHQAIAKGYSILNCSFGCAIAGHLSLYKEWANSAMLANVHVVAACGTFDVPEWPAWLATVLGVDTALDSGSDSELFHRRDRMIEFSLGGEYRVPWRDGDYRMMRGSSFAAAHMTGLVARLLSKYPEIDTLLLKSVLRHIAKPVQPTGRERL